MAEIQNTVSSRELNLWSRYRAKNGPLDPIRKYDAGAALITSMIANTNGGKTKPRDFMPYSSDPDEKIVGADEFVNLLKLNTRTEVAR